MQAKSKVLHLAISVMIGGSLLAACGPAKSPNTSNPVSSSNPGTPASSTPSSPGTVASNNPGTPASAAPASGSASNAALVSGEMQAVAADDATIADSQKADSGFVTQALNIPARGEINARGDVKIGTAIRTRVAIQVATRSKLTTARQNAANMAKAKKSALQLAGVTVNANGTLTINPSQLKAFVKAKLDTRRAGLQELKSKYSVQLANLKAVAAARLEVMRRKHNAARTSDVVETTSADGSKTRTLTVEFKNEKTGVTRNITSSRTSLNAKLVSADFDLKVTGPKGFLRTVSRTVTVNADGSRSWSTTAHTSWANGATSERSETREVGADGSATGSGTLTIKRADGSTKTYTYTVGVTAGGDGSSGDETVECSSGSTSPDPSASPSPSPTPEATATPAASASPTATVDAGLDVTVQDDAATTTDTVVVAEQGGETTEEAVDESADADAGVEASGDASVTV